MVKLLVNLAIAAWLLVSSFVLTHSTATAWNSMIVAVLVAALALTAFVAVGLPALKYGISVLAIWLFASAMFMPHESLGTVLHDVLVACVLALVSLLPSHQWAGRRHDEQAPKPA